MLGAKLHPQKDTTRPKLQKNAKKNHKIFIIEKKEVTLRSILSVRTNLRKNI